MIINCFQLLQLLICSTVSPQDISYFPETTSSMSNLGCARAFAVLTGGLEKEMTLKELTALFYMKNAALGNTLEDDDNECTAAAAALWSQMGLDTTTSSVSWKKLVRYLPPEMYQAFTIYYSLPIDQD